MSGANYNGRQPNNSSYVKTFVPGSPPADDLWTIGSFNSSNVLTPSPSLDLYIPTNILLGGKIIDVSNNDVNNSCNNACNIELLERIIKLEAEISELKKNINK